jgi:hypothetical protein
MFFVLILTKKISWAKFWAILKHMNLVTLVVNYTETNVSNLFPLVKKTVFFLIFLIRSSGSHSQRQGCQIFLGTTYRNGKKYTK